MERLKTGAQRIGIHLDRPAIRAFERYRQELISWNSRVNLTSISEPERIETLHFLDSLSLGTAMDAWGDGPCRLLDVGSGAGFPGIPLKLAFPTLQVTLLEATGKKAAFLSHVIDVLGLKGIDVVNGRAEEAAHDPVHRAAYDLVVARAVAPLSALVELTLPFCKEGGMVIAPKKGSIEAEIKGAAPAIESLGGVMGRQVEVSTPELGPDHRFLVVIGKARDTPTGFPRRSGVPRRRPLSARQSVEERLAPQLPQVAR